MDELRAEARAAVAIARKELRIFGRYRLNAVNQVIQPLYQTRRSPAVNATFSASSRCGG